MTDIELKAYLKDIMTLENILYTYQNIEQIYVKKIRKINEEKNTVFLNDQEDYKRRKFHRTPQSVPAPDVKPNYIDEKKSKHGRTIFIYGFHGVEDMYRRVPERWLEDGLSELKQREHNKYRNKHILAWMIAAIFGIVVSLIIQNIIPLIISIMIAGFISYRIGNENQKKYIPGDPLYDEFMEMYTQKYNADLKQKDKIFSPQIQKLTTEYEEQVHKKIVSTQALLEKLYAKNVLHPKYHDFIAVTQLYDYLNIGRCAELEGADGAYNMYEQEKNDQLLITDLDMSLFKIEKYESVMYTLVNLLKQHDRIISKVSSEINRNTNTTLTQINVQFENQYLDILQRY